MAARENDSAKEVNCSSKRSFRHHVREATEGSVHETVRQDASANSAELSELGDYELSDDRNLIIKMK